MFIRCPLLVGRQEQTSWFDGALRRVADGGGEALFVTGEPGIGKSRLVQEFLTTGTAAGLLDVVGRAVATGTPVPLRPFVEAMLSMSRRGLLPDRAAVGSSAPSLARVFPPWAGDQPVHDEASCAPVLGEALLSLFRTTAPGGCLLVLEDLHWADPESLAVVEYLCDHAGSAALAVVATVRNGVGPQAWAMVDALVARGHASIMELAPLDADGVRAMVTACGLDPTTAAVAEQAEGVPLFVEELLGNPDPDELPRTVVESVRRRLTRLEAESRRVMAAAALCGRHFDWRLIGDALSLTDAAMAAALRAGIGAGLVEADRRGYRFHHALFRDAVLADLTGPEGAELAALLGAGLDRRHPDLPGELCVLAADLAAAAGGPSRAVALQQRAARRALREGALTSATALLRRGIALADARPARIELGELLADALCRAGRLEDATTATHRLLADVRGVAEESHVRARAHLRLARAAAAAHRWELAEVELGRADRLDPSAAVHAGLVRAMIMLGRHAPASAAGLARGLVEPALELGHADVACAAMEVVGRAARRCDPDDALAAFATAHALAVEHGLPLAELSALHELGTIDMFTTGRLDRLQEARRRAVDAGAVTTVAVLDLQLVPAHYMRGEAAAARAAALRAIDGATVLGLDAVRRRVVAFLPHTAALRGDRVGVERDIAAIPPAELALDPDAEAGVWGTARGTCSLLLEDRRSARAEFETAARIVRAATEVAPHSWWGFWVLVRAIDGADARAAVATLRSCSASVNRQNVAFAELAEAVLLGRSGAGGPATAIVESFGSADIPWPWQRQLARRLVAEAALEDGWGSPVAWLREAETFFDDFGAPAVAHACRALGARARVADDPAARSSRHAGVTPRENEVLALLRDGLSNRELARHLSISPRTIEKHVESLCHKLGARGRGPLIALAARPTPDRN